MSVPNKRRRGLEPKKSGPRGNPRFPKRDRVHRRHAWGAAMDGPRASLLIPVTWLNTALGVTLLPFAVITTLVFFSSFAQAAVDHSVWRTAPFWFFFWGLIIWLAVFWAGFRPRYLYVLGHELTHVFFVIVCGGRVIEFQVSREGGHVVTDKNNLLISLSPYFVPFWSLVVTALYGVAAAIWDLGPTHYGVWFGRGAFRWDWLLFFTIGYSWGFHFTFTLWMITKNQPDLRQNGTFFSFVLIYFVNLLLIVSILVAASPDLTWSGFADEWARHLQAAVVWVTASERR
ncbi:MAG: hypothetical protein ACR2OZ_18515 [Verrucomicrobiales bacterium]